MNRKKPITYAFIDSQNLNLGVLSDVRKNGKLVYRGKKLDFKKFRDYLRVKFGVKDAYLFIGNIPEQKDLYLALQRYGYKLIMKPTVRHWNKDTKKYEHKGNVDTDIVLYSAAKMINEYTDAVFVSGDGDFVSTYEHIAELGKLKAILVPNRYRYSSLLKVFHDKMYFVSDNQTLLLQSKRPGVAVGIKTLGMPGHGDEKIIAKSKNKVNRHLDKGSRK